MESEAKELKQLIDAFQKEFVHIDEKIATIKLSKDRWTLKEIIGHLIDSASNNHQRFIRLQLSSTLEYPDYKNEEWLRIQKHNKLHYTDLFQLFISYNKLIMNIISNINEKSLQNKWNIEWIDKSPHITLEKLIAHYIEHIRGHLGHFRERLNEVADNGNDIQL